MHCGDQLVHHLVAQVGDGLADVLVTHDVDALLEDHLALIVHHVVVLEHVLARIEVARLDLLLRLLQRLVDPGVGDRLAFLQAELLQHAVHAVGAEDAHQVVFERQVELGAAGIALAARTAAQLVVDAPALVALGAEHVEPAGARSPSASSRRRRPGSRRSLRTASKVARWPCSWPRSRTRRARPCRRLLGDQACSCSLMKRNSASLMPRRLRHGRRRHAAIRATSVRRRGSDQAGGPRASWPLARTLAPAFAPGRLTYSLASSARLWRPVRRSPSMSPALLGALLGGTLRARRQRCVLFQSASLSSSHSARRLSTHSSPWVRMSSTHSAHAPRSAAGLVPAAGAARVDLLLQPVARAVAVVAAELDVGAAAGHVGGDRDRAGHAGLGDDHAPPARGSGR